MWTRLQWDSIAREVVHCLCVSRVGNTCEKGNCSVEFVENIGIDSVANLIPADPGTVYSADTMQNAKGYATLLLIPM